MMTPSHLLATLLIGLVWTRVRPWSRHDWAMAVGFGVVIDFDHLTRFPAYLVANGVDGLQAGQMSGWGAAWQGAFHTPWALAVVVPAALFWRTWVPLAFWALHMLQDFVIATKFVVFGSTTEWLIIASLATLLVGVLAWGHRDAPRGDSFRDHVTRTFGFTPQRAPRSG